MLKYLSFFLLILLFSCQDSKEARVSNQALHLIPYPAELMMGQGAFVLKTNTSFSYNELDDKGKAVVQKFLQEIKAVTGYDLKENTQETKNVIQFQIDPNEYKEESYALEVSTEKIQITANSPSGFFYAIQTLRQLLPAEFTQVGKGNSVKWTIPAVKIADHPRFAYRGMHLDVARHFSDVSTVKKFIDQMAYHKLNHFHWHLTEDQGWRIEIKQFPKLTEIGAFRNGTLVGHYNDQPHQFDGEKYGGYYTQEEIKEVVAYAAERFITVVPEIEMPGHAQAALAAYPELACTEGPFEVWQKWGVSEDVFCPTEKTFEFLEKVIDEVVELFPGKYLHIGGDECPKTRWKESAFCQELMKKEGLKDEHELQSYFIQRMEKYINSKGKQIIGWDEILEGGLAPNATVMSWRGIKGGVEAAKSKHDVIMSPTSHCYLDYYQSDHPDEPIAIGGFLPLEKVYSYEPIPEELNEEESKYVLGAQGNIWTEYMKTPEKIEYMAFPRLSALAEVVWSPKESRNFEDFVERLVPHIHALELMGVRPANHLYDLNSSIEGEEGHVKIQLNALAKEAQIRYTVDGSQPDQNSLLYTNPIQVNSSGTINAQAFVEGQPNGRSWSQNVNLHLAAGQGIALTHQPHPKYSGNGPGSVINGVVGSNERYGDAEWLGFDGQDFEAVIDLGKPLPVNNLQFRFFKGEGQWIYLPRDVEVFSSSDGDSFESKAKSSKVESEGKVAELELTFSGLTTRYLKIHAKNFGTIPDGKQGAGNKAWLFVDEILLN